VTSSPDFAQWKCGVLPGSTTDDTRSSSESIATAARECLDELGADLAITYLDEKPRVHVEPLAEKSKARILAPLNVWKPATLFAMSYHSAQTIRGLRPRRWLSQGFQSTS
jgi:hypothetical protein